MAYILQLLKYLRSYSIGKEFTDSDILDWANTKVRSIGSKSCMKTYKMPPPLEQSLPIITATTPNIRFACPCFEVLQWEDDCDLRPSEMRLTAVPLGENDENEI
ncbi:hypothetical protein L2E82_11276 [Cichorium intybus]|uniref:Uncharacterized protein n=1 Tax=Cichorium intybus TaxID=13427 RepID=A0ACB9GCR2_CICIN|nr:hypothetical protein L2E82_11276 [Cichorium intybus]